jgi:hypothetical protein
MTTSRDDDALSWAGDSDPTLSPGDTSPTDPQSAPAPDSPDELPEGWTVAGPASAVAADAASKEAASANAGPSSLALVATGVLAGIYLLYTIGWFLGVSRVGNPLVDPVGRALFSVGGWLAVAAPLIWFAAAYGLTSERPRSRFTWLVVGAVLLAPLPVALGAGGIS